MIRVEYDELAGDWNNVDDECDRYTQDGDFFIDRHNRLFEVEKMEDDNIFVIKEIESEREFEIAIRCDLNEETYIYKVSAKNESEACDKAKDEFCHEFLNILTKEDYDELFEEDKENEE